MERKTFIKLISLVTVGSGLTYYGFRFFGDTKEVILSDRKLSKIQLKKLLDKITLGQNITELNDLHSMGYKNALHALLNKNVPLSQPINFEFEEDVFTKIGESWVHAPNSYTDDSGTTYYEQYRKKSIRAWLLEINYRNSSSLHQNMLFFWLNYFSISDVVDHRFEYEHVKMLYENSFGNLKQVVKNITVDPAMLRFLSGFVNSESHPNENFARELLELFTIGKGEMIAPGDYSTYKESDIGEIAKALTGWRDKGWYTLDENVHVESYFDEFNHNKSEKNLSEHFSNLKIPEIKDNENCSELGAKEYEMIIDQIFMRDEVSVNFCSKLYRWFCDDEISKQAYENLIIPLAKKLKESDYELKEILFDFFASQEFVNHSVENFRVKNPLHFIFSSVNFFPLKKVSNEVRYHQSWAEMCEDITKMGMEMLKPPSVGGWKAYYQAPNFSKLWINSATLTARKVFIENLLDEKKELSIDIPAFIEQIKPTRLDDIIAHVNDHLFYGQLANDSLETAKKYLSTEVDNDAFDMENYSENKTLQMGVSKVLDYLLHLPSFNLN